MKYIKSEWIQIFLLVVILIAIELGKEFFQQRQLTKQRKFYEQVITREVEKRVRAEEKLNFTELYSGLIKKTEREREAVIK